MRTFGYDPCKLSRHYTLDELERMLKEVTEQHTKSDEERANQTCMERLYLIDKKGRWKCDQITWAMHYLTKNKNNS